MLHHARKPGSWLHARGIAILAILVCTLVNPSAHADIDLNSGIDFVTVGSPGNTPWSGDGTLGDLALGRGRVDHEYRMGRFEVTTAQWVEFYNAAFDRPASDRLPFLTPPTFWGAVPTSPSTPGGRRWTVPAGQDMWPTGNINWRMAAMYCNWLHNGKATNRDAFLSGAYEVSTFGYGGPLGDVFTDQAERSPGARYFIPTWDEWLKAAHYDPNKNGPGQEGWWKFANSSDVPPLYGPPGAGGANSGWRSTGNEVFQVPLGAYPQSMSPWGLFDTAGATSEWTETIRTLNDGSRYRMFDGTSWDDLIPDPTRDLDWIGTRGDEFPSFPIYFYGFRVAAAVPAPGTSILGVGLFLIPGCTRRRR